MGKLWRSLNLKLVVLIYLLLLQASVCWFYYFHALTTAQIIRGPCAFIVQPVSQWLVSLDVLRPVLLVTLFCRIKRPYFFISAAALILNFRPDLKTFFLNIEYFNPARTPGSAEALDNMPTWQVNLLYNPLARYSLLYEIVMRLWVVVLVIEDWRDPARVIRPCWRFSLMDVLVFMSLLAATFVIVR